MPKKKSKENAIKLLTEGTDPQAVAEQTGYSIRRIYDFKKELENAPEQPQEEATDIAPLQLQQPATRDADIEGKLEKALDILLDHLDREVTTDTVEGIIKISEAIRGNRRGTYEKGTRIRTEADAEQDAAGTSADAENFADILEKTSEATKTTD